MSSELLKANFNTMGDAFGAFGENVGTKVPGGALVDPEKWGMFWSSVVVTDSVPLSEEVVTNPPALFWTLSDSAPPVPGRVVEPELTMEMMSMIIEDNYEVPKCAEGYELCSPSAAEVGEVCAIMYEDPSFGTVLPTITDPNVFTYGMRHQESGSVVSVALGVEVGGDVGVYCVATLSEHQRKGLATALMRLLLNASKSRGIVTSSLQTSPDGRKMYESLGYKDVGKSYAWIDPAMSQCFWLPCSFSHPFFPSPSSLYFTFTKLRF